MVVVGARCAGASLAMLLARRGHRVALVDRAAFPSDTISSHFLWPQGAALLEFLGPARPPAIARMRAIPTLTFDFGSVSLTGSLPSVQGVHAACCPRRTVLDSMLVEAALEAGAELSIAPPCVRFGGLRGTRAVSMSNRCPAPAVISTLDSLSARTDGIHSSPPKLRPRCVRTNPRGPLRTTRTGAASPPVADLSHAFRPLDSALADERRSHVPLCGRAAVRVLDIPGRYRGEFHDVPRGDPWSPR